MNNFGSACVASFFPLVGDCVRVSFDDGGHSFTL